MRTYLTMILLGICVFTLAACDSKHAQSMQQMQRLQILVDQALITAAHGANLKLEGDVHGQILLGEAGALLRRALSGPEMTMMHKGVKDMPAGMKQTHDLGDAAFDLLGLMMALTPDTANASQLRQLNERLAIAASGSTMLLQSESGGDLKPAMIKHARTLLQQASLSFADMQGKDVYHKQVGHLLELLSSSANPAGQSH